MTSQSSCPTCGDTIPIAAPAGACPRCLVKLAFDALSTTPRPGGSFPTLALNDLAPLFPDLDDFAFLGAGGMGVVYRARQIQLDRVAAIKLLPRERVGDPEFSERFLREARALARLNHPHIVGVYDAGRAGDFLFIVMEYVEGASLRDLMREGSLRGTDLAVLAMQLCDALQYAHDQGVIHRDIKPENVLLDAQGRVKVADFGLAKLVGGDDYLTATNVRMGTPRYMAPEQMKSTATVDHRADLYSLGVMLREMMTGARTKIDPRWGRILQRLLKESPDERYQQARDVKADLERLSIASPRIKPIIVGGLLALLVSIGIVGVVLRRPFLMAPETPSTPSTPVATEPQTPSQAVAPFTAERAAALQETWAKHLGLPIELTNSVGMTFRLVPPGEFKRGSTLKEIEEVLFTFPQLDDFSKLCLHSEWPLHRAIISHPFYIGVHEVTQQQYEEVMGKNPSYYQAKGDGKTFVQGQDTSRHPVEVVSWRGAFDFCAMLTQKDRGKPLTGGAQVIKIGYRLPTEAEWEYACRAGTETRFWTGDDLTSVGQTAWFNRPQTSTHPVGLLKPNPFGLADMLGNVSEWCQDGWDADGYKAYQEKPATDPVAPHKNERRMVRGGFFGCTLLHIRAASRIAVPDEQVNESLGFRVVLPVEALKRSAE